MVQVILFIWEKAYQNYSVSQFLDASAVSLDFLEAFLAFFETFLAFSLDFLAAFFDFLLAFLAAFFSFLPVGIGCWTELVVSVTLAEAISLNEAEAKALAEAEVKAEAESNIEDIIADAEAVVVPMPVVGIKMLVAILMGIPLEVERLI